jgi:DNA-binding NtrC family response regulator
MNTCADDPRSWVELLDRLGALPKLSAVLQEAVALLRRHLNAEAAVLLLARGHRLETVARSGEASCPCPPELLARTTRRRPTRIDGVSALLLEDMGPRRWFLLARGNENPDPSFVYSGHMGFLRCALRAYASAFKEGAANGGLACPPLSPKHRRLRAIFPAIVSRNPTMLEILSLVQTFATTDYPVLIQGESGTGKELIARAIHEHSQRREHPYVTENCAAVPDTLLEAEFFGVARGAFTGATNARPGLLRLANQGTLFLDEIGEMSLTLQKKLLRVVQEKELRRVGGHKTEKIDIRLISATNQTLEELAAAGSFRSDLYFRINTVTINLPPLRDRREDIELLAAHFLREVTHGAKIGGPPALSPEALGVLTSYGWPGNIRELRNEIMRSAVLATDGIILPAHLSGHIHRKAGTATSRRFLQGSLNLLEYERETVGAVIQEVLASVGGNKAACAKILGVPKTTLYRRMQRYDVPDSEG